MPDSLKPKESRTPTPTLVYTEIMKSRRRHRQTYTVPVRMARPFPGVQNAGLSSRAGGRSRIARRHSVKAIVSPVVAPLSKTAILASTRQHSRPALSID
ncbi:MAG: hypothetical protein HRF40_07605 [Nitrososphaera sp.]